MKTAAYVTSLSLFALGGNFALANTDQIPGGAVMAFDLDRCPKGWAQFSGSAGRLIVGAGGHFKRGQGGPELSKWTLSPENIPVISMVATVGNLPINPSIEDAKSADRVLFQSPRPGTHIGSFAISASGGKENATPLTVPHWSALLFCKKE